MNSVKENALLKHVIDMTDNVGILEHCLFSVPDKTQGYTLDDNARALQLMLYFDSSDPLISSLEQRYLIFLLSARTPDGFHNDLKADLSWEDQAGIGEWFGRAMAALGSVMFFQ